MRSSQASHCAARTTPARREARAWMLISMHSVAGDEFASIPASHRENRKKTPIKNGLFFFTERAIDELRVPFAIARRRAATRICSAAALAVFKARASNSNVS